MKSKRFLIFIIIVFSFQSSIAQNKDNNTEVPEISQQVKYFLQDWLLENNKKSFSKYFSEKFYITCFDPNEDVLIKKDLIKTFSKSANLIKNKLVKEKKDLTEIVTPSDLWVSNERLSSKLIEHPNKQLFHLVSVSENYFDTFVDNNISSCTNYGKNFVSETLLKNKSASKSIYMVTFEFKEMKEAQIMMLWAKIDSKWNIISFENATN